VVVVSPAVVVVVAPVVVEVVELVEVVVPVDTPHTDWPMKRSPTAVGPIRYSWAAYTVIELPVTTCSLKTIRKLSCWPLTWMWPV